MRCRLLLRIADRHCEAALRELILGGGELTRKLFGFEAGAAEGR